MTKKDSPRPSKGQNKDFATTTAPHHPPFNSKKRPSDDVAAASIPSVAAPPPNKQQKIPKEKMTSRIINAVQGNSPWLNSIPSVPTYSPTVEQWQDPLEYIRSIQPEAEKYGGCIIKPPVSPAMPASLLIKDLKFSTRLQYLKDDICSPEWNSIAKFWDSGKNYRLEEYIKLANDFAKRKLGTAANLPTTTIESVYWKERELGSADNRISRDTTVEYGNDVEGTAFSTEDPLGQSKWNLRVLPNLEGSALRFCEDPIPGISSPMLYIGMLFASFAWHVEDHFMHSINYAHQGAPKIWYCVPASVADAFEATAAETVYKNPCDAMAAKGSSIEERAITVAEALAQKSTILSPKILLERNIPVFRAVQEIGSYIVTFPRSYHSGFSAGFHLGEAVNFSLPEWWFMAENARQLYRRARRSQIISHELILFQEARALGQKLGLLEANKYSPKTPKKFTTDGEKVLAAVFLKCMRKLNHLQYALQSAYGAAGTIAFKSPAAREIDAVFHCQRCHHQCYIASVMANNSNFCLQCAVEDKNVREYTQKVLFLKPCWQEFEDLAKKFEAILVNSEPCTRELIAFATSQAMSMVSLQLQGKTFGTSLIPDYTEYQWKSSISLFFEKKATVAPAPMAMVKYVKREPVAEVKTSVEDKISPFVVSSSLKQEEKQQQSEKIASAAVTTDVGVDLMGKDSSLKSNATEIVTQFEPLDADVTDLMFQAVCRPHLGGAAAAAPPQQQEPQQQTPVFNQNRDQGPNPASMAPYLRQNMSSEHMLPLFRPAQPAQPQAGITDDNNNAVLQHNLQLPIAPLSINNAH